MPETEASAPSPRNLPPPHLRPHHCRLQLFPCSLPRYGTAPCPPRTPRHTAFSDRDTPLHTLIHRDVLTYHRHTRDAQRC